MNLKKYQCTIGKKLNLNKKSSVTQNSNSINNQNTNSTTNKIKVNKLNSSQQISINTSMNNNINKVKNVKNRRQINLYSKPFQFTNNNIIKSSIKKYYYETKVFNKNKNKDFSLMNSSNSLYDTIDFGRNAINNLNNISSDIKKETKIKVKEKTPFKNRINLQENKENYQTNVTNKIKNIYKTKTSNNLKNRDKISFNFVYQRNNNLLKSTSTTKENINKISLRLYKNETISSKNKYKRHILYTPKKRQELNSRHNYSKSREKTIQKSAKRMSKYLLTSQNSESRFYTDKTLSPEEKNIKKKKGSVYSKVNYALNNYKNITNPNIALINRLKNIDLKINTNTHQTKDLIKSKQKNEEIHNYLYHNINSPLSQEIIISESKGIISTKCPLGHILNYNFNEFFQKFRAIPDNIIASLIKCFICKASNNPNFFCEKCFNFICNNCLYNHDKKFGHKIIILHNMNSICSSHNKKFNSFCFDCNRNCCDMCHINYDKKNHNYKTFSDVLKQYKSEEKSILNIQNEIRNQLRTLNDFIERYNEDLKKNEHSDILKGYLEEYINYFKNLLQLKEKFISKYNHNPNNYYNLMNVLNLSLPLFYDYNKEQLFKLARTHDIYDKYLIINDFINFVNNNSINIFQGNQNYKKYISNINSIKSLRTIKPNKMINIKQDSNSMINDNKYPKQILDLEYKGYFLLLKDFDFDIYDKDLNIVKSYCLINIFGNSYNEMIIGAKLLENKSMAIFNYKRIIIIQFGCDFLSYQIINEFDIKLNGNCNGLNNFGFDEDTYEIQNTLINNVLDMNTNEIISFGIRLEDKYIGTIWQKNKRQESQIMDINSNTNNSVYNIISVLKYDENKFAILEKNNDIFYNVKIYNYESPYTDNPDTNSQTPNKDSEEIKTSNEINQQESGDKSNTNDDNIIIYNMNSKDKVFNGNGNNYEKDEVLSDNSEENIDEILQEIRINAEKREEEFQKLEKMQKRLMKEKEDIIVIRKKIFDEIFNMEKIKYKKNNDSSSSVLSLIKINNNIFAFLDFENIILVDFLTCTVVSKIFYGTNIPFSFIDKTPNDNLLFKEKNKIISYHIKRNDLIRINLPVYEYIEKRKKLSKWYLISGSENEDFINKAKIIDNSFMICLFEFRLEKWNLNQNLN